MEETGVSGYEVEKSTEGTVFQTIGSVNGQGDGQHNYSFTEIQPLAGTAYYRIKQIDLDGRFSYSNMMVLHGKNVGQTSIYPNPARDFLTIAVSGHLLNKNAVLTDLSGRVLQTVRINSSSLILNVEQYPAGAYFIKVANEDPVKIIKE